MQSLTEFEDLKGQPGLTVFGVADCFRLRRSGGKTRLVTTPDKVGQGETFSVAELVEAFAGGKKIVLARLSFTGGDRDPVLIKATSISQPNL